MLHYSHIRAGLLPELVAVHDVGVHDVIKGHQQSRAGAACCVDVDALLLSLTCCQVGAEVARLRAAAHTIRTLCTDDVRTGAYFVRCRAFKEMLAASAEALALRLLEQVRHVKLLFASIRLCLYPKYHHRFPSRHRTYTGMHGHLS